MSRGQESIQLFLVLFIAVVVIAGLMGPEEWRPYTTNIGLVGFLIMFWHRGLTAMSRTRTLIGLAALYTVLALAYWGWLLWS